MNTSSSVSNPPTTLKETTANIPPRRASLTSAQQQYIVAVQRAIQKYMRRHYSKASMTYYEPSDLISFAIEKVIRNLPTCMQRYPDPVQAAHAVARNAAKDHARRIRVQRGEGARGERTVVGLQAPVNRGDEDSPTWEDMLRSTFEHPESVVERIDVEREVARVIADFSAVGLDGALAGERGNRTQGEIAAHHGVRRETVNRVIKSDQQRARAKRAANERLKQRAVEAARNKFNVNKRNGDK